MDDDDLVDVGPVSKVPSGTVTGAERWAVGKNDDGYFAVTRRCRHLFADLAEGTIDKDGCLVCPWHSSKYDVKTGQMVRGPQGLFAKIPGCEFTYKLLTKVVPLGRGEVVKRKNKLYVK